MVANNNVKQDRIAFAMAAAGVCLAWFGTAYQDEEITREEMLDLIKQILSLVGMRIQDIW